MYPKLACFSWLLRPRAYLVGMAHVDYTANSGIDRLDALLPDEAEKLRETPFAVVQVNTDPGTTFFYCYGC